jgi:hypothetical protein
MVTKPEARELIARAVLQDTRMPSELDVILREPDADGKDATKTLPLLLVELDEVSRPEVTNSDFVGYKQDNSGNDVARVFESEWEATAQIELWTAAGSSYDVDELGEKLHEVLYSYDSRGTDECFTDADGSAVTSFWNFSLGDGSREDDLTQTPTVRRWRQLADVYGARYYVEDEEEPIREVEPEILDNKQENIIE